LPDGHQPRLLHQRSQFGYTASSAEAMTAEPEAVSADEQRRLTRRAHNAEHARDVARAEAACDAIAAALDQLAAARTVESNVRAMRRQLAQLRRKLGAGR